MEILLQQVDGEVIQGGGRSDQDLTGKLQPIEPVEGQGLRSGKQADCLNRHPGEVRAMAGCAQIAEEPAGDRLELVVAPRHDCLPARGAPMEIRPVAGHLKEMQVSQKHDLEWIFCPVQGGKRPSQQSEELRVGVVVTGEADEEFADIHRRCIPAEIGTQDQVGGQYLRLADQQQARLTSGEAIVELEQREFFEFVDKSTLAFPGPLGDTGDATEIRAVEGDQFIRFPVADDTQYNPAGGAEVHGVDAEEGRRSV